MNKRELDAIVASYDLNQHAFYRAWRAGTLPRAALEAYAAEYEPFIASIELGWSALGEGAHAAEERCHAGLWARFREALGSAPRPPSCPETQSLAVTARDAFEDEAGAIGALYAFEAQQPSTAATKLEGLTEHYGLPEDACAYFRIHGGDYGERDRLAARAAELDEAAGARAIDACERLSRAMWSALDGLLRDHAPGVIDRSPGSP